MYVVNKVILSKGTPIDRQRRRLHFVRSHWDFEHWGEFKEWKYWNEFTKSVGF